MIFRGKSAFVLEMSNLSRVTASTYQKRTQVNKELQLEV